jgi:carboxyl-terminal processing protease
MKFRKFLTYFSIIVIVFGAYLFGYTAGHADLEFKKGFIPQIKNIELGKPQDIDFSLFWDVWNKIEEKYAGKIDKWKMFYGAISGMVEGLSDPYTSFLDPEQSKKFLEEIEGEFEGVGIELANKNNKLTVVSPLEDSPAQAAGIRAGDVIDKINGKETASMSLDEAVEAIRGQRGTEVVLTISRDGKSLEFKLKRTLIKIKSVKFEMKGDIAYLKVSQFIGETKSSAQRAASLILTKKPKGIVLDLRNNPGGYLDAAVDLASLFIKEGVIVYEQEKSGDRQEMQATGGAKLFDLPLVVLINGGSASGSEIVAGAIQDYKKGLLIGEKTFGKGTVQSFEELKGGSTLRITVAKWLTPNGRAINEQGLIPDIEIKMSEEDINAGRDPQLERAIQELSK